MNNIRNFFIAFIVSLITFGVISYFLINGLIKNDNPLIDNSNEHNEESSENVGKFDDNVVEKEIQGKTFTVLLACTDELSGRMDAIMLVRVDKENKKFVITSLPSNMVLNVDSIEYYLGDLSLEKGNDFLLNKIFAITGISVDYYAFMSLDGFSRAIDELGGVTFTVPEKMYYKDCNDKVLVNLSKGTQILNGDAALQLLRYNGYEKGDKRRREVQREFAITMLDTFLKTSNITKAPGIFKNVISHIDTNFTSNVFTSNIELIFSYNDFELVELEYPGVSNITEEGERFIPRLDEGIALFKKHK